MDRLPIVRPTLPAAPDVSELVKRCLESGIVTLGPTERNIAANTVGICPVYVYGLPPDVEALVELGRRKGIPVYFDSAQGLGATYQGRPAGGFGTCEVFSLSPTKVVTAGEGGLIANADCPRWWRIWGPSLSRAWIASASSSASLNT